MSGAMVVPKTYQQWMECLDMLGSEPVTDAYIESLRDGTCPGAERVIAQFVERVRDTVNEMLNRCTRSNARKINELLEDGDPDGVEMVLRRSFWDMLRCRFYRNICFIPEQYVQELDENTVAEIRRYWKLLEESFSTMTEETGNAQLEDIVYTIRRLTAGDNW